MSTTKSKVQQLEIQTGRAPEYKETRDYKTHLLEIPPKDVLRKSRLKTVHEYTSGRNSLSSYKRVIGKCYYLDRREKQNLMRTRPLKNPVEFIRTVSEQNNQSVICVGSWNLLEQFKSPSRHSKGLQCSHRAVRHNTPSMPTAVIPEHVLWLDVCHVKRHQIC